MSKRIRKKRKIGEFTHYVFSFEVNSGSEIQSELDLDLIIDLCERSKLSCFGGFNTQQNYVNVLIVGLRHKYSSFVPSENYLKSFQEILMQQFFNSKYSLSPVIKEINLET
jgi:hypothetical protein